MAKGKPRGLYLRTGARNKAGQMMPKNNPVDNTGKDAGISNVVMEYCHICKKEHPVRGISGGD